MVQTPDSVIELQMTMEHMMTCNLLQSEVTNILTSAVKTACSDDKDMLPVFVKHGWNADSQQFQSPIDIHKLYDDLSFGYFDFGRWKKCSKINWKAIECEVDRQARKKNWNDDIDWATSRFSSERLAESG